MDKNKTNISEDIKFNVKLKMLRNEKEKRAKRGKSFYFFKNINYFIQGLFIHLVLGFLKMLPIDTASSFGGFLGSNIFIHTKLTKIAKKNLNLVYPDKSEKEINTIVKKIWNNVGRIAGEYVNLNEISSDSGIDNDSVRVNVLGIENIKKLRKDDKSILFVSAHMGNWEIIRALSKQLGQDLGCVYRAPNNPYVRKMLNKMRKDDECSLYEKSREGMVNMARDIKKGLYVGLLVDQWLTEGTQSKFLNQETMSPSSYAKIAKKHGGHIVPIKFVRVDGKCKFQIVVDKEIEVLDSDSEEDITQKVNYKLSDYINEKPEDWLWIHDRFKCEELFKK